MYRKIDDFIADWNEQTAGTLRVIEAITDDKLGQAIVEGHSTLGWLGWHLATSPAFFTGLVGVKVQPAGTRDDVPGKVSEIAEAYRRMAADVQEGVTSALTDDMLSETVSAMGREMARGKLLRTLLAHDTHHRGQMTVLLRQAGLTVPGVMGPTKEQMG
ncbi:DinB family protein [Paenibacillus sp. J2TS4]|uniref:DinB family protein n=1 Tax=Paenibacillus sp. J2TS4 TaxID=2807194 RepID=UPI001B129666|nr:DinB family protein [Paenibacillus sp. J2TS4]GIP33530.1 hypothetical protein J2TS4_27400 [Paenibacillus sp. J2TS4]